jgi:hypothetical protein
LEILYKETIPVYYNTHTKDINTDFEECPDFSAEPGSIYINTRLSRFTMYVIPDRRTNLIK